MKLTEEQAHALKCVVAAKLRLWQASQDAEELLGSDIDTSGESLDALCVGMVTIEDAFMVTHDDLVEAFELEDTPTR